MTLLESIVQAEERIRPYVRETPLDHAPRLSAMVGAEVLLKLENLQHTGSFKVRGALNALLSLTSEERSRGVVAASSGNHGMALAYGIRALGARGTVVVPVDAAPTKIAAIKSYGAEVIQHGDDCLISEHYARGMALERGMTYISPYNDWRVVEGQGTIGVELERQAGRLDAVFLSVGGGGLIGGTAAYLKARFPKLLVVGCQPEQSAVMAESVKAGQIVELADLPTLSDGTAGGIESGSLTFGLCRDLVDQFVLVTEEEIAAAMRLVIDTQHMLIEGAAGVALAGLLRKADLLRGNRVAVVLCGANVSVETLRTIL